MKSFSLTETEMLTLEHESIVSSPKSFFLLDLVQDLAHRKCDAGALLTNPVDEAMLHARVWKKTQDNGRRNRTNWSELHEMYIPGSQLNRMFEARYGCSLSFHLEKLIHALLEKIPTPKHPEWQSESS
jgi:hypothetical protein